VKRTLPVLVVLLLASCNSSEKGAAGKGPSDAQDEKYNQALEYYTLTHDPSADPNSPPGTRGRFTAVFDARTAKHMMSLQQAMKSWRLEKPDARVPRKDQEAVEQIVQRTFQDPMSRAQMVVKTYDLKLCEKVAYQFYNKNRCIVNIMFYNRGPMIQAGLDLYLFKYKDRWEIAYRVDWIG
jgi:hypothetical protein